MPGSTMHMLSVAEAATLLGVAPRTVRRWLQEGDLVGKKLGTSWVVLCPADFAIPHTPPTGTGGDMLERATRSSIRQHLRQLGHRLIVVGNATAGAQRRRGEVFLTWRYPGRLQIAFAMGRTSPTRGWAPHALGIEFPFWLKEHQRWQQIKRLLRQYERLRLWCHPRLLRIPQVQEVIEMELQKLHTAIEACATQRSREHERPLQDVNRS